MLFILDKLFILFLYVNVLTSKLAIGEIPVSRFVYSSIIGVYLVYYVTHCPDVMHRSLFYIFTSIMLVLVLASVSLFYGNQLENVMLFVWPLFILLLIPAVSSLLDRYSIRRYIIHFAFAVFLLSAFIVLLYIITIDDRSTGFWINDVFDNISVTYPEMGFMKGSSANIRIYVNTSGFFAAGLLMFCFLKKKSGSLLYTFPIAIVCASIFLSHTFTILVASVLTGGLYIWLLLRKRWVKLLMAVVLLATILSGVSYYLSSIISYKEESIVTKRIQVERGIDKFISKPLLGEGLGCIFYDMDDRGIEDVRLESSYIMIIASTGIVGALFYMFIYLYYPLLILIKRQYDSEMLVLILSQISILIAAAGNPFIWSGGMGLIFIVMIAALYENRQANSAQHAAVPAENVA